MFVFVPRLYVLTLWTEQRSEFKGIHGPKIDVIHKVLMVLLLSAEGERIKKFIAAITAFECFRPQWIYVYMRIVCGRRNSTRLVFNSLLLLWPKFLYHFQSVHTGNFKNCLFEIKWVIETGANSLETEISSDARKLDARRSKSRANIIRVQMSTKIKWYVCQPSSYRRAFTHTHSVRTTKVCTKKKIVDADDLQKSFRCMWRCEAYGVHFIWSV